MRALTPEELKSLIQGFENTALASAGTYSETLLLHKNLINKGMRGGNRDGAYSGQIPPFLVTALESVIGNGIELKVEDVYKLRDLINEQFPKY